MLVSEDVACPHVGLGVFDGGRALREPLCNVEPFRHGQPIRAALHSSASAYRSAAARSAAAISMDARDHCAK